MSDYARILAAMREGAEVSFADLKKVCDAYFGQSRVVGSHHIYKMPWPGDPRINIQKDGKAAKRYQVKQALRAIEKLEGERK